MEGPPEKMSHSELSGSARDVVQARDITGGIHFHRPDGRPPIPRQLPSGVAGFVDRVEALRSLNAALDPDGPSLALVVGMPGVGKTSLALHWAHSVQDRFPDGQLYVDLRGYDPDLPVTPQRALERFLSALGVARGEIPYDLDECAALYRSLLADRRILILLNNAATIPQIRPLLPGSSGCLVLATSRSRLSGLVVRDGARRVALGLLAEHDAITLLENVTRTDRPDDDPGRLAELAELCARLPLALRIAAERAVSHPWTELDDLIAQLRGESALWKALTTDKDTEIGAARSVFTWSYQALPRVAARLFCVLALHPGPDFSSPAVAALTGMALPDVRRSLDILIEAHLLEHHAPDRYQFHELVRSYAMDQARRQEPPEDRRAFSQRILVWYLRTVDAAQSRINPNETHVDLGGFAEGPDPETFASYDDAIQWYEREQSNLVGAVKAAEDLGMHEIAWKLAVTLRAIYMRFNPFEDWIATAEIGLRAAQELRIRRRRLSGKSIPTLTLKYPGRPLLVHTVTSTQLF